MKGFFLEEILNYMKVWNTLRFEEKRDYQNKLIHYIEETAEQNLSLCVARVELIRGSYNFKIYSVEENRVLFNFNPWDSTYTISFDGKYSISIKLNRALIKEV